MYRCIFQHINLSVCSTDATYFSFTGSKKNNCSQSLSGNNYMKDNKHKHKKHHINIDTYE